MLAACRRDARTNGGGARSSTAARRCVFRREAGQGGGIPRELVYGIQLTLVGICSTMTLLLLGVTACLPYTAGEQSREAASAEQSRVSSILKPVLKCLKLVFQMLKSF